MTWNTLNERTGYMLEDMNYYGWHDLEDEKQTDEQIWSCDWLDQIIDTLHEIYRGFPSNYDAEILETEMLINELQAI